MDDTRKFRCGNYGKVGKDGKDGKVNSRTHDPKVLPLHGNFAIFYQGRAVKGGIHLSDIRSNQTEELAYPKFNRKLHPGNTPNSNDYNASTMYYGKEKKRKKNDKNSQCQIDCT